MSRIFVGKYEVLTGTSDRREGLRTPPREDRSDTELAWGVGFGTRLGRGWALQIEVDGHATETVSRLELLSLGAFYRF